MAGTEVVANEAEGLVGEAPKDGFEAGPVLGDVVVVQLADLVDEGLDVVLLGLALALALGGLALAVALAATAAVAVAVTARVATVAATTSGSLGTGDSSGQGDGEDGKRRKDHGANLMIDSQKHANDENERV